MYGRNHRAIICLEISGYADFKLIEFFSHSVYKAITGLITHRHNSGQGHATLASRSVGCAGDVLNRLLHICVWQDNTVILSAAHGLHTLAVFCATAIHIMGNIRRANKTHSAHRWVCNNGIHCLFITIHHVQYARGRTRFQHQFCQPHGYTGIFFRWLKNERTAGSDCHTKHPHWDHCREVKWRNARDHANGLAHAVNVNARACALGIFAFHKVGYATGKLDHI